MQPLQSKLELLHLSVAQDEDLIGDLIRMDAVLAHSIKNLVKYHCVRISAGLYKS